MSAASVIARLADLSRQIEKGDADVAEIDAELAAARAVAQGASAVELAQLAAAISVLGEAAQRQLELIEGSIRQVGQAREAVSAYGTAIRPYTRGQFVRTSF